MAATQFETENLIAGPIQTQQVKLVADTYYRGMPLEYDADNDRYKYLTANTSMAAIWLDEERTLESNEYGSVIMGGEVLGRGIVDDAGDAYTITEDLIAAWAVRGFYVKR